MRASATSPHSDRDQTSELDGANLHVHVLSPRVLLAVFAILVMLTIVTVLAASMDVGSWEIWISIGIATLKATLVAVYFMHLRYDKSFNTVVFVAAIVCLALFLALTLADVDAYQDVLTAT